MATSPQNDLDEKYNPTSENYALRRTHDDDQQAGYNDTARQLLSEEHLAKNPSTRPDKDSSSDSIEQGEQSGSRNPMNFTGKGLKPGPGAVGGFSLKSTLRKKGPIGVLIAGLMGLAVVILFPAMAPFAMLYNVTNDLNDHLAALDARQNHIFRGKVNAGAIADDTIKGCTKLSIRCKMKTLSNAEVKRLERAGFRITGVDHKFAGVGPTRLVPTSYEFRGQTFSDGREFLAAIRENPDMRSAHLRANNMKSIGYSSKSFMTNVMHRFGATKAPRALSGNINDRMNQLLTAARTNDMSEVTFRPVAEDGDGPPYHAVDRHGNIVLDTEGNPQQFSQEMRDSIEKRANPEAPRARSTPTARIAIGALSIAGAYDIACTARNMIGAAAVGAKVAVYADTLRYAAQINANIGKIQAGQASPEEAETVGKLISDPDMRRDIIDLSESVREHANSAGDAEFEAEVLDVVTKDNPHYNKNFMDASLINMSTNGGYKLAANDPTASKFSFGGDANSLVRGLGFTSDVLTNLLSGGQGNNTMCKIVQHPISRGIGILASIIIGIGSWGTISAVQVAALAAPMAAVIGLGFFLNAIMHGSVIDDLAAEPNDKASQGNAYWAGNAALNATAAQSYGMKPSTANEIVAYQSQRNQTLLAYSDMESRQVNPLDASDPRSHLGSVINNIHRTVGSSPTITSLVASVPRSISHIITPSALASAQDIERFQQCDDKDLGDLNIDADIQCNVRYTMSSTELNADPDEVAKWMEDNGYVEPDTETGLPAGYTPPDAEEAQNAVTEFIRGSTIGQFVNRRASQLQGPGTGNREYAYFLEYCTYRVQPYGETFEEALWGGAGDEWMTGKMCVEQDNDSDRQMISNFRIYTMDRATEEGLSEEVDARTGGSSAVDNPDIVSGDDQELAQAILDNENIILPEGYHSTNQLKAYANGDTSCYLHPDLLKLIASLGETHNYGISSLNRQCVSQDVGAGSASLHWRGRAVDIHLVDGRAANGKESADIAIYNSAMRILPDKKLQLGQMSGYIPWNGSNVVCRPPGSLSIPPGNRSLEIPDLCNHIHIGIED